MSEKPTGNLAGPWVRPESTPATRDSVSDEEILANIESLDREDIVHVRHLIALAEKRQRERAADMVRLFAPIIGTDRAIRIADAILREGGDAHKKD